MTRVKEKLETLGLGILGVSDDKDRMMLECFRQALLSVDGLEDRIVALENKIESIEGQLLGYNSEDE